MSRHQSHPFTMVSGQTDSGGPGRNFHRPLHWPNGSGKGLVECPSDGAATFAQNVIGTRLGSKQSSELFNNSG